VSSEKVWSTAGPRSRGEGEVARESEERGEDREMWLHMSRLIMLNDAGRDQTLTRQDGMRRDEMKQMQNDGEKQKFVTQRKPARETLVTCSLALTRRTVRLILHRLITHGAARGFI